MTTLRVNHSNRTLEILAKIMNSYAIKYNCSVKYNHKYNSLNFHGEIIHKDAIAYETLEVINGCQ